MTGFGVSVSHWQGVVNWKRAEESGVQWAFARASIGATGRDRQWETNRVGLSETEILPGAYHLFKFDRPVMEQVLNFLSVLPAGFVPAVDLEVAPEDGPSQAENAYSVYRFVSEVEARSGSRPVIYTRANWWADAIGHQGWEQRFPLWVADWRITDQPTLPAPWQEWTFWQDGFVSSPEQYGFNGQVTRERFSGQLLSQWWAWNRAPANDELFVRSGQRYLPFSAAKYINRMMELKGLALVECASTEELFD